MPAADISVIIPTRNRFHLLARAVASALEAGFLERRIIVVDDHSGDGTPARIRALAPQITVVVMDRQGGPGRARNAGLERAATRLALMLDDDDTVRPEAIASIDALLASLANPEAYPVFQFAQSNAAIAPVPFVITLADYADRKLSGDFAPVLQVPLFHKLRLAYPESVIGGESLLWFQVARDFGIPTSRSQIISHHSDAPSKLCSVQSQLRRPREYAESVESILRKFGSELQSLNPSFYRQKRIGAATYRLLAGDRRAAFQHASALCREGFLLVGAAVAAGGLLPLALLRQLFKSYRKGTLA